MGRNVNGACYICVSMAVEERDLMHPEKELRFMGAHTDLKFSL